MDGRMEKPGRVDAFRYLPEPLHFLRFHYADRTEDDSLLMTGADQYKTGIDDAKQWVLDELQVEFWLWESVDPKTGLVE